MLVSMLAPTCPISAAVNAVPMLLSMPVSMPVSTHAPAAVCILFAGGSADGGILFAGGSASGSADGGGITDGDGTDPAKVKQGVKLMEVSAEMATDPI